MQLLDHQAILSPTGDLPDPIVNAQSPSGRWQLTALPAPNHKVSVAFWLNQEGHAHLLRRWELPGVQAAKLFVAKLKRQLGQVPDLARPSQVLAMLPIQAQSSSPSHRHHRRQHQPIGRLSGA